jgi:hypothetical protein
MEKLNGHRLQTCASLVFYDLLFFLSSALSHPKLKIE